MRIYERLTPLDDQEQIFARENHKLLIDYIKHNNLELREFYDVCVFGYLKAVKRWFSRPELHVYKFSTIANKAMRSYLYNERQKQKRRIKTFSLNVEVPESEGMTYTDCVTYDNLEYIDYI